MGKKHKKPVPLPQPAAPSEGPAEPISSRGKGTVGIAIGTLAAGFVVLSFADPMGRNWAAHLAPFLILGGYALAGIGIFLPSQAPFPPSGPGKNQ